MRYSILISIILVLIFAVDMAAAATLHGSIYDIELNELNNVVVEVDSEPAQRFVSKEGQYSFELSPGDYTLTANFSPDSYRTFSTVEAISIVDDGDFVFDLFLFPGLDQDAQDILDEADVLDVQDVEPESKIISPVTIAIITVLILIALLVIYYLVGRYRKREEKEEIEEIEKVAPEDKTVIPLAKPDEDDLDRDLNLVMEFMKQEGGRTTQKQLRKEIPYSEAKISLMITELVHRKVIKKVKKGRGNILILRKK